MKLFPFLFDSFIFAYLLTSESYSSLLVSSAVRIFQSISSLVRIIMPKRVPLRWHHDVIVVKSTASTVWIEAKYAVRRNLLSFHFAKGEIRPAQCARMIPNLVWFAKLVSNFLLSWAIELVYFLWGVRLTSSSVNGRNEMRVVRYGWIEHVGNGGYIFPPVSVEEHTPFSVFFLTTCDDILVWKSTGRNSHGFFWAIEWAACDFKPVNTLTRDDFIQSPTTVVIRKQAFAHFFKMWFEVDHAQSAIVLWHRQRCSCRTINTSSLMHSPFKSLLCWNKV